MATATIAVELAKVEDTGGLHFLNRREKLMLAITACRSHNWSFPIRTEDMKVAYCANAPYDSHQTCPECGTMRLYNQKVMSGGPVFTKELKQHG